MASQDRLAAKVTVAIMSIASQTSLLGSSRFASHRINHEVLGAKCWVRNRGCSQDDAAATALALFERQESGPGCSFKHIIHALAAQARTLQISLGADVSCDGLAVVLRDESHRLFAHLLDSDRVFSQVLLQADEDDGDASAQSGRFLDPLYRVTRQLRVNLQGTAMPGRRTLCLTLSSESGVSTEKPTRITCAFE